MKLNFIRIVFFMFFMFCYPIVYAQQLDTIDILKYRNEEKLLNEIDSLKKMQSQMLKQMEDSNNSVVRYVKRFDRYLLIAIAILILFTLAIALNVLYNSASYKEKRRKTIQRRNIIIEDLTLENTKLKGKWYAAKEQITEVENLCKSLITNLSDTICITSRDGNIEYVSVNGLKMFGFADEEQLIGNHVKILFHPTNHEFVQKSIEDVVVNPAFRKTRVTSVRFDNSLFETELITSIIHDAHNQPSQILFIISDVTEYVYINHALSLRNRYLDTIINIQWYLSVFEEDENYWNKILQLLGSSSGADRVYFVENSLDDNDDYWLNFKSIWASTDDFLNHSVMQLAAEPYKVRFGRWYKTLSEERIINSLVSELPQNEMNFFKRFGTHIILAIPLIINERFHGFLGFEKCTETELWDKMEVTMLRAVANSMGLFEEKKESKLKLRKSEEYFRALIQNSSDVIALIDKKGKTVFLSPSFEKTTGWKVEERLNRNGLELIHQDDKARVNESLRKIQGNVQTDRFEFRMKHKNGDWIYMETVSNNLLEHPAVRSIVINYRDITSRKRAEEILRNSELRFKNANATKDKLISIIAHDLKNPFNTLINISGILMDNFEDYSREKIKGLINQINETSRSTFNLLENLLQWSRTQTNTIQYQPENISLNDIVEENILLLQNVAQNKLIEIQYAPIDHTVYADANMLHTVLRNLITNAIKFTPIGGRISITTSVTPVAQQEGEAMVVVAVADNGVGISNTDIAKLFRIDKTTHTTGTLGEEGTGLGLILCKEFINRNKGEIYVESVVGKGSTFRFTIPVGNKELQTSESAQNVMKMIEEKPKSIAVEANKMNLSEEAMNEMSEKLFPMFEANRDTIFFDKVEEFAYLVKLMAEKYGLDVLDEFGKNLLLHSKNFDAENVMKLFAEFEIFAKIKSNRSARFDEL